MTALLLELLFPVVWTLVGSSAVYGLHEALSGLVAKTRAQKMLQAKAIDDAALRSAVARITALKSEPSEELRAAVATALAELSKQDKKFVDQGLNQSSRQGATRYIQELVSAA